MDRYPQKDPESLKIYLVKSENRLIYKFIEKNQDILGARTMQAHESIRNPKGRPFYKWKRLHTISFPFGAIELPEIYEKSLKDASMVVEYPDINFEDTLYSTPLLREFMFKIITKNCTECVLPERNDLDSKLTVKAFGGGAMTRNHLITTPYITYSACNVVMNFAWGAIYLPPPSLLPQQIIDDTKDLYWTIEFFNYFCWDHNKEYDYNIRRIRKALKDSQI